LIKLDFSTGVLPNTDLFLAMYVRKEALLSSQIEGTQASLDDIFAAEEGDKVFNLDDVEEVVNYIAALNEGIKSLEKLPMSLRLIREIHERLMKGVRGKNKTPGEFRRSQNWIGPAGATLKNATFVPPPVDEMKKALNDLELYIHKDSKLHVLIDCALIHYQFESIHPFLDGNGRVGRLLITFYLYWKGLLHQPLLYLSVYFKKNQMEYYHHLNEVREKGAYEEWIRFFLIGVIETGESGFQMVRKILKLHENKKRLLMEKWITSPYAPKLVDHLFVRPRISIKEVAKQFDISFQSASTLIRQFEKINILKEITGQKREQRFQFQEYIDLFKEV
jgi:Fic family protein